MPVANATVANRRFISLIVVVSMSFMATLDASIVNIALPVMAKSLAAPLASIEWVIASYVMIICSTLLLFGRLGDIMGKSRIFSYGTLLFTLGTLLCGCCRSLLPLIVCRFIQGVGASAYMANNQGIVTQLYPREERGKALGILAAAVALGTMVGAPLGGFIVSA
ncbi:MAG: MFS transporter, partial [Victivallales bacterium]|nr:MFS transporter [Victivallales bacterium]